MPSPIELLMHPVSLIIFGIYAALMLWEAVAPGRSLPPVPGWHVRGLIAFGVYFFLSSYLPLMWDRYLAPYQLVDLSSLAVWQGAIVGVLVYELGAYGWHRLMHRVDVLWRTFHQMHHSAERLDVYGAFFFSPLDMVGWTALTSLCLTLGVGLNPQATTITLISINFLSMLQHANIRTPSWLGYIVQRPESHSVHHGKGIHRYNYADLPLFDVVFGTFKNPVTHQKETGFYPGASSRVLDMLLARDISMLPSKAEQSLEGAPASMGQGLVPGAPIEN